MIDGTALLMTMTHALTHIGMWTDQRENNLFGGGYPFYATYETSDARFTAVGCIEPKLREPFLASIGFEEHPPSPDPTTARAGPRCAACCATRSCGAPQADWADLFASLDVYVTPILATAEAARHPHHVAREIFTASGPLQASAAPRLSRTPGSVSDLLAFPGEHTTAVLAGYGIAMEEIAALREREVIA